MIQACVRVYLKGCEGLCSGDGLDAVRVLRYLSIFSIRPRRALVRTDHNGFRR